MTTSDTPKGKMLFSSPENLASWGPSADSGVIACMTAADAQKAETLFNGLQRENNALREELASNRQAYRLKIEALEELLAEKDAVLTIAAKVLEAAIEHYDIENEKDKKGRPDRCGCNVCQAVCGMKG